jgi:hypothetical protein
MAGGCASGTERPRRRSASYISAEPVPAPTVASSLDTDTAFIGPASIKPRKLMSDRRSNDRRWYEKVQ